MQHVERSLNRHKVEFTVQVHNVEVLYGHYTSSSMAH